MSQEDISAIITKVKEILKVALEDLAKLEESWRNLPTEAKLDLAKIEALPWTAYRSGKGEWLLHEKYDVAKPFREALEKAPNKSLDLGAFHFKLGGDRRQFISRFPISEK